MISTLLTNTATLRFHPRTQETRHEKIGDRTKRDRCERRSRTPSCWEQETADRPPLLQQSRFWNLCEDRRRSLTRVTDTGRTGSPVCTRVTLDFLFRGISQYNFYVNLPYDTC
eukprot:scaffold27209_cov40-Attheya_sp.AAC.1